MTRAIEQDDGFRPIHAGCYEPFLLYGYLRGLQTSMEDLALRPEIADAILGRIFDFYYEHHRRIFEAGVGRIDLTWVAEDLGSQTGPLMSLAMYRRFLLPNQIKMAELARSYGVHVMYHTDGAARAFLPDLIDRVGIEILNPIQWRVRGHGAGEARRRLWPQDHFPRLDRQPADAVVRQRRRRGPRGPREPEYLPRRPVDLRSLPQPPTVSPTENIVAMYEAIHQFGCAVTSTAINRLPTNVPTVSASIPAGRPTRSRFVGERIHVHPYPLATVMD